MDASRFLFVGAYTEANTQPSGHAEGICVFRRTAEPDQLELVSIAREARNPSFLALHPSGRFLYAVNELEQGSVSAFAVAQDGRLRLLAEQSSGGSAPAHLSVDASGSFVLVANYVSGSWAVLPIRSDGGLEALSDLWQASGSGPDRKRQEGPHAHFVTQVPGSSLVLGCDLGCDRIRLWRLIEAPGRLEAAAPDSWVARPGSGPRHACFHPALQLIYVVNELDSTVDVLAQEPGGLSHRQTVSCLPSGFSGESTAAEIALHPSGRLLYISNRGHDSVAAFAVDPDRGDLTPAGWWPSGGKNPRSFAIEPEGSVLYAANQDADAIVSFAIDRSSGHLSQLGQAATAPCAVCLLFDGSGRRLGAST
ncbi:MAG: lactonase family protein [Candidatus Dormibacteraeota bacterium]|nr:lactonase family protein [Candidatus Dormibacteraeota bacterium]